MTILDAGEARLMFATAGYSGELRVVNLTGTEAISDLFHFNVELAAQDANIDLDAVVGQPAELTIASEVSDRLIFGIIRRFEQAVAGETFTPYFAEVVPSVWILTQMMKSRIFQQMTTEEIIEQVLTDAGISSDGFRFALSGSYEPRDYCVQYRETDWNFVARLMEEEGIFYFFEHSDDQDILVMADSADVHVPIAEAQTVVFRDRSGAVEGREFIYDFRFSQQLRPGKATLKDFNFETPSLGLMQDDSADRNPEFEVYEFPGLYGDESRGGTLAGLRLESAQARRLQGQGHSICPRLISGSIFSLDDYPRTDLNQDYLIMAVHHHGTQPLGQDDAGGHFSYNNTFKCIPSSVPFRPLRRTPKPVVEGTQTAIVTGPSGEEVYTDEYGRVKVQFHWDREGQGDENTSCWIRVAQLWAGKNWGAMFIPRIGHEVIVDFIEGDPDRPIITGRVYHAENMPPYPLDDDKTKSTIKSDSSKGGGGSNELRFEDKKDEEEVYLHAQKNTTIKTENDKSQNTGHDETLTIGNDRTKTVKHDETTTVENNRTETVNGNETITIKKNREVTVTEGNETIGISTGTQSVTVQGDASLTVAAGNRTVDVNGDYNSTATGAVNIEGQGTGVTITGTGGTGVKVDGTPNFEATGAAQAKITAPNVDIGDTIVKIHGSGTVEIACGGSSAKFTPGNIMLSSGSGQIILDPSGVTIMGAMVKIN
ncbi:MAG: type VI secretion system tip protein VgrG [candidate division Zixibacteria bacterium]|nr:type VI secretion system tip protein VgrG [candidate division Zixibacteria bacterium]